MTTPIHLPLINPNEPELLLASIFVSEGQFVKKGDLICTLETTKSTAELNAEGDGYIIGLRFTEGQSAIAGEILCYLADTPDWEPPQDYVAADATEDNEVPQDLRITRPARELAQRSGLDFSILPRGPLVTESMVKSILADQEGLTPSIPQVDLDPHALIIYGGGGHGKSLIDLVRKLGIYEIKGILDDGIPAGENIMGAPVLGGGEVLPELYAQGIQQAVNAVGGIGNLAIRRKVFQRLSVAGFKCPTVVHPTAFVEENAELAEGVQVFPLAYVGSEVEVGYGSIINTSAVVSHECRLGEIVNISPGALLAGGVQIGDAALVGMGVTINLQVKIGAGARIGNGATVKADVPSGGIVHAGSTWPE